MMASDGMRKTVSYNDYKICICWFEKYRVVKKIHIASTSQFKLPNTQLSIPAASVTYSSPVGDRNCRR